MTTRRRPMAKQATGNEGAGRKSIPANASRQSLASAATAASKGGGQNENMPIQSMAGGDNPFDEANLSEDEEGGTRIGDIYIPPPIPPHCSTESKGPRLIIKKIENNNFKSYAGKVILGPFHHVSMIRGKER